MKRPEIQGTCFTVIVSTIFLIVLLLLPTGFESAVQFKDAEKCKALVMTVDNSRIIDTGLIRTGQQICSVRFLDGKFKGKWQNRRWNANISNSSNKPANLEFYLKKL